MKGQLAKLNILSKRFAAVAFLTSGTLAWFFLLDYYFTVEIPLVISTNESSNYFIIGQLFFYGFAIFSAIIGSLVSSKVKRRVLLLPWIILGVMSTVFLAFGQNIIFFPVINCLLGISLGLGLPSSMALIADSTRVEERARVSGFIILSTFLIAFASLGIIRVLNLDLTSAIILFAAVRSISLVALFVDTCEAKEKKTDAKRTLSRIAYKE